MADRTLQFEIYRLNIVDEDTLTFDFMGSNIRTDEDIQRVLQRVTDPKFDLDAESGRTVYRWSAREYMEVRSGDDPSSPVTCILTFGRSMLQQRGQTVTDSRIEEALTTLSPPSAEVIHLFFYMARHLVSAEYSSSLMQTLVWRDCLHSMLDSAAEAIELRPGIRLEPLPRDEEIMRAFRSFQRLTRLRVRLRIPNPEMDRRTERLRGEMVESSIREYTQDMKNPAGLSQSEDNLPHATAAMAQAGYKDGEVVMSGIRDGRRRTVRTGKRAARGRMEGLRDFVRGIASILDEVDRIAELPVPPGVDGEQ